MPTLTMKLDKLAKFDLISDLTKLEGKIHMCRARGDSRITCTWSPENSLALLHKKNLQVSFEFSLAGPIQLPGCPESPSWCFPRVSGEKGMQTHLLGWGCRTRTPISRIISQKMYNVFPLSLCILSLTITYHIIVYVIYKWVYFPIRNDEQQIT